jgi:hypothetical protein
MKHNFSRIEPEINFAYISLDIYHTKMIQTEAVDLRSPTGLFIFSRTLVMMTILYFI